MWGLLFVTGSTVRRTLPAELASVPTWPARRIWSSGDNGSVRMDHGERAQPDVFLMIEPERGGQARITDDDYVEGAPSLSPRSRPAASATTWARSCTSTGATRSVNTSSGEFRIASSTGSCSAMEIMSLWRPETTGSCAARSSLASGLIGEPFCVATWPRCWPLCSRALPRQITRPSSLGCAVLEEKRASGGEAHG